MENLPEYTKAWFPYSQFRRPISKTPHKWEYELTRMNTNEHEWNMNEHEWTRMEHEWNTNEHEWTRVNTSEHEWTQMEHEWARMNTNGHEWTRMNTNGKWENANGKWVNTDGKTGILFKTGQIWQFGWSV